jgi:prophage maintenance system killer protein
MQNIEPTESQIWYPSEKDIVDAHDVIIQATGGWSGFEVGIKPFAHFLEEMKTEKGIYRKGAVLLRDIVTSRMFEDAHHRTAYVVTKDFLQQNKAKINERNEHITINFIKNIRKYSIDEIASWLEYGSKE